MFWLNKMLLMEEISNRGKKSGENVCFSVQDPEKLERSSSLQPGTIQGKQVVWKFPSQRGLLVSSRDKCQSKGDFTSLQRPG